MAGQEKSEAAVGSLQNLARDRKKQTLSNCQRKGGRKCRLLGTGQSVCSFFTLVFAFTFCFALCWVSGCVDPLKPCGCEREWSHPL